jgi:hypothetical protein
LIGGVCRFTWDAAGQPVTLAGLDSPAMRWLLRDRPLESRAGSGAAGNPPIVITPDVQDPALATAYRGQGLIWRSTPLWSGMQFLQWLPFHDVPPVKDHRLGAERSRRRRANTSPTQARCAGGKRTNAKQTTLDHRYRWPCRPAIHRGTLAQWLIPVL